MAPDLTDDDIIAYLERHPDFLLRHPELFETLTPPQQKLGENIIDFQHYALSSLQRGMQSMKDQFEGLLNSARDNMSAQGQIHKAVIEMVQARNLTALLEVLTTDLPRHFDVDAVRIVIESDMAELYESAYSELNYSGISFVPRETVDLVLGSDQQALLISDTQGDPPYAYESIFVDCNAMIHSCALLRLYFDRIDRDGILAFGVREANRFSANQGTDLLRFLADVTAVRLNYCLGEDEALGVI
jgi:uncharacterized protein YigA (DUF484 family)